MYFILIVQMKKKKPSKQEINSDEKENTEMKRVKKYFMLVLVIVIAGTSIFPKENIIAKKKSTITEYLSVCDGRKTGIKKVKLKKKSIVVWGRFERYRYAEGGYYYDDDSIKLKSMEYKKRTFKLAKNVKYLVYGSQYGPDKYTKKEFKKTVKECRKSRLVFGIKRKNGKVIEVYLSS